ncbi:MAG: putative aminohydrolase SsnA [Faecousia sp.]
MYILANGKLITRSETLPYLPDGGVVIDGTKIKEVGKTADLKAKYPDAEFIDAKGGVIMPAFINAHTHIYSALARGLSIKGNNPTNFFEVLDGTWWAIDRNLYLNGTKASANALYIDCIKQGVTTVFDHHASYGEIPGSLHTIAESAKKFGIRSCLCYEVSDRDGEEKCLQGIKENADFITECEQRKDPMLAAMFGGHALFTISDKTFERMVEANNGRTGYHIHVSEGMNDVYDSLQNYGRRPIQRLQDHGILGPKTILGHCIHVNSAEIEIIKNTDTMVVNNPESNMGNAVGTCPVLPLYKAGILLGMGTDAYTNDMLESLKVALCAQRQNACLPNVGWCEVTDMLFKNNAKIGAKYFPDKLGVLEAGAAADVIVMDYKPFTPFSSANIDGHMIFGMTGRQCQTTIANGKLLMKDRELIGIDEEAENAHILEEAKKLWGDLNHCKYDEHGEI